MYSLISVFSSVSEVSALVLVLQEQRQLTHENVQRKQARTGEERDEEDEEQPSESESEDEENEIIYNPKNLPLGWDGKVRINSVSGLQFANVSQQIYCSAVFFYVLLFICH